MDKFYGAVAGVMLAVILILALKQQGKEMALLLSIAVCCMVGLLAESMLKPVVEFLKKLQAVGDLDGTMLQTLFKVVGISMTAQIAGHICADSGSGALGKMLELLASIVIVWLSLPMLTGLLELVEGILGNL